MPSPDPQPVRSPGPEKFSSWKEIAAYFNTTVRTVQRWESREQLPMYRHRHAERNSVYAYRSELDEWWSKRQANLQQPAPRTAVSRRTWIYAAIAAALAVGLLFWWLRPQAAHRHAVGSLKPVPLTSYPGDELYPTFSPDATQVAFAWNGENQNNFDIYVKVVGAGAPLRVTSDPRADVAPAWSPDGRSIAFLRTGANIAELMLVPPLGGAERKLAEIQGTAPAGPGRGGHFLSWSPDSKWLAVAIGGTPNRSSPPIMVAAGTGETRAIMDPVSGFAGDDVHPAFSPNGRTLAFSRRINAFSSEIYLLDLSNDMRPLGRPRQLTAENQVSIAPVWSVDGREVIFISGTNPSTMGLWTIAAGGGKLAPLELGYTPINTVMRAGKRLAFSHQLIDSDIWRVDLAGAGDDATPKRMISSSRLDDYPQFSPDGSKIAFRSTRSGNWEIHLADRDGSQPAQLTSLGGPPLGPARWSPDGKQLAFVASRQGSAQIYPVAAAGGPPRPVYKDPSGLQYVNWSRAIQWIYFVSRRSGRRRCTRRFSTR